MPHLFTARGTRLSYSNGIISLAIGAVILLFIFDGQTDRLIPSMLLVSLHHLRWLKSVWLSIGARSWAVSSSYVLSLILLGQSFLLSW